MTYKERYLARGVQIALDALERGDMEAHQDRTDADIEYRVECMDIRSVDRVEAIRAAYRRGVGAWAKAIIKACKMQGNLGNRAAAGYLRNQKVPVEIAAYVLATVRLCSNWFHD